MPDPTKPPDWMARQVMAQLDGVFPSVAEMRDAAVLAHYERRLAEDAATIADLRSRLLLFAEHVCRGCGCAVREDNESVCYDCARVGLELESYAGAHVSVGMRALCGRRILEGC